MTTNQTIDGVSRGLLASFAEYVADSPNAVMRARAKELRALLDAPADPKPTGLSQGWNLTRKHDGFVVGHQSVAYPPDEKAIERAERDGYVWVPFLVPAAQPQGEPVAWMSRCLATGQCEQVSGPEEVNNLEYWSPAFPVYAEQPAPVAEGTTSDKYRAELYDEVWQKARQLGFGNVTEALTFLEREVGEPHAYE